jgi:hypothetical protein
LFFDFNDPLNMGLVSNCTNTGENICINHPDEYPKHMLSNMFGSLFKNIAGENEYMFFKYLPHTVDEITLSELDKISELNSAKPLTFVPQKVKIYYNENNATFDANNPNNFTGLQFYKDYTSVNYNYEIKSKNNFTDILENDPFTGYVIELLSLLDKSVFEHPSLYGNLYDVKGNPIPGKHKHIGNDCDPE